jgi:hypothetical protein
MTAAVSAGPRSRPAALLLAAGVAVTLIGMAWLSRLSGGSPYLIGVALPMVLIGIGQGGALGPLTAAGIAGVAPEDAGAASGPVNVAHQLGGSLGLGVLVTVFAAAGRAALDDGDLLAHRVATALTAGTVMLALVVVLALIVRPGTAATAANAPASTAPEGDEVGDSAEAAVGQGAGADVHR